MKSRQKKADLMKDISIKRELTSGYNHKIFNRANTTYFDIDKAHYEADLLLEGDEEIYSKNQFLFERKHISICKFYFHLFESIDYLYLILSLIGCIIRALSSPVMTYLNATVFSDLGNTSESRSSLSEEELMKLNVKETMESNIKKQLVCGAISFVGTIIAYFFFGLISTRCLRNFKKKYFTLILSQEQAWFDSINIFEFSSRIQSQLEYMEIGMGEHVTKNVVSFLTAIACFIFGFFGSWKLALVLLCITPIIIVVGIYLNYLNVKGNTLMRQTWEAAGGIAEEILYNIKNVESFSNFDYELRRYYEKLETSNKIELYVNNRTRLIPAILYFLCSLVTFFGFLYGRTLVGKDYNSFFGRDLTGGDVLLTFDSITGFINNLSAVFDNYQYVQLSVASSSDYFNLYERRPQMDLSSSTEKPDISNIRGEINFNNVEFYYPSDSEKKLILKGINLNIESGKKIALIGESGCGKTTIVNLIERFYDINKGEILLDGIDIRNYDIQYLRNLIGYVEQEPVLFNRSIRDNILFGRENLLKEAGEDIDLLIKNACDDSYASEFIDKIPEGLNYIVGINGNKLSGGQKQRISIARAILIKPKILILDEATSNLDTKSEKIVQKALDNISKKKITTIIIAHRLSTIKNSDIIYALKNGEIYEKGTHEELLQKGGYYAKLIRPQLMQEELEKQGETEILNKKSTIKRVDTNEEVTFENKISEIEKSPEDIKMNYCNVVRECWNFKLDFILTIITCVGLGVVKIFEGIVMGYGTNALNSNYQTIRYDKTLKYSWIFLILSFVDFLMIYLGLYKVAQIAINLGKIYRKKMMKKYLSFHLSYFDLKGNSPGSILTKMAIETAQLRDYSFSIVRNALVFIGVMLSILIIGCCYEYRLTLIVFAFVPFVIIVGALRRLLIQKDDKKSIDKEIESGEIISECSTNSKIVFAYNLKNEVIKYYMDTIDYITQQQVRDCFIDGICLGLITLCGFLVNVAIYGATKHYILNDTMDSEDMLLIQIVMMRGFDNISSVALDIGHIKKANIGFKYIYSVLETESLIPSFYNDNSDKISANNITGKIEFKNVYFAYPTNPEKVLLKNISMTIMPGQRVALVGYSGSGKSSIIQLLNRFYDVEDGKGEILIDDINIKNYNLFELRKKIGFVSQDPSIFKNPIIENIRYGNLDATDEECYKIAEKVSALNILEKDKNSGNKRILLSRGQKQKISVARTYLKNPKILLLDEPTSALDKESEIEVQNSLDELSNNKTTIAVSHNLKTIEHYDQIYLLDKGRIKEHGTHDELMKLQKRYYTLQKFSNIS